MTEREHLIGSNYLMTRIEDLKSELERERTSLQGLSGKVILSKEKIKRLEIGISELERVFKTAYPKTPLP